MANWLVNLLVLLGVLAIVIVAGWFILGQITMPDPIRKIVIIVFVVLAAVIACIILLSLPGARLTRSELQFPAIGAAIPAPPDIAIAN